RDHFPAVDMVSYPRLPPHRSPDLHTVTAALERLARRQPVPPQGRGRETRPTRRVGARLIRGASLDSRFPVLGKLTSTFKTSRLWVSAGREFMPGKQFHEVRPRDRLLSTAHFYCSSRRGVRGRRAVPAAYVDRVFRAPDLHGRAFAEHELRARGAGR